MGPTTIDGLPAHPLLVHVVVVLVPLSAIMLIASVAWPAARRKLGILTPLVTLATLISVPLTSHAGEWLLHRTQPQTDTLRHHAQLGDQLIWWSIPVCALSAVWWSIDDPRVAAWLTTHASRLRSALTGRPGKAVLIAGSLVAAVGSLVWVYRIGDSGAHSVWGQG